MAQGPAPSAYAVLPTLANTGPRWPTLAHAEPCCVRCARRACRRAPRKDLSDEQRESLGKSLFSDYLSAPSLDEAVAAAQELDAGGFMPKLVQVRGGVFFFFSFFYFVFGVCACGGVCMSGGRRAWGGWLGCFSCCHPVQPAESLLKGSWWRWERGGEDCCC